MTKFIANPHEALAFAIIEQAMKDAVAGKYSSPLDAKIWLRGTHCKFLCDLLGIRHSIITMWITVGCPDKNISQRLRKLIMN